jgi:hypothetical protein
VTDHLPDDTKTEPVFHTADTKSGSRNVEISGKCDFKPITLAWNQLAAADDGERTWIAIPQLSDSSLSIRTTTPTNVVFNGLSG